MEWLVSFVFGFGVFFAVGALVYQSPTERALSIAFALVLFGCATFYLAPRVFGYGHVSPQTESFDRLLDNGGAYQETAWTKSSTGYVLLVRQFGTQNFYAIRVKTVPPPLFTLVSGRPIAIAAPDVSTASRAQ